MITRRTAGYAFVLVCAAISLVMVWRARTSPPRQVDPHAGVRRIQLPDIRLHPNAAHLDLGVFNLAVREPFKLCGRTHADGLTDQEPVLVLFSVRDATKPITSPAYGSTLTWIEPTVDGCEFEADFVRGLPQAGRFRLDIEAVGAERQKRLIGQGDVRVSKGGASVN